jgi:hypothetical protein
LRPGEAGVAGELRPAEVGVAGELRPAEVGVAGELRPAEVGVVRELRAAEVGEAGELRLAEVDWRQARASGALREVLHKSCEKLLGDGNSAGVEPLTTAEPLELRGPLRGREVGEAVLTLDCDPLALGTSLGRRHAAMIANPLARWQPSVSGLPVETSPDAVCLSQPQAVHHALATHGRTRRLASCASPAASIRNTPLRLIRKPAWIGFQHRTPAMCEEQVIPARDHVVP